MWIVPSTEPASMPATMTMTRSRNSPPLPRPLVVVSSWSMISTIPLTMISLPTLTTTTTTFGPMISGAVAVVTTGWTMISGTVVVTTTGWTTIFFGRGTLRWGSVVVQGFLWIL